MLASEIAALIQQNRLELYGQPKWTIGKNTCNTYEVFVEKLLLPDGAEVPAKEVIDQIEMDSDLTDQFSNWFMKAAMDSAVALSDQTDCNMTLSMNMLPLYTNHRSFPQRVEEALAHSGLRPDKLQFELSESQELTQRGVQNLNWLHDEKGIGLWLANFGTAHSNISLLNALHVDGLEVDRSFAAAVPKDDNACKLLVAIAHFADTMDLKVCGKGVETEEQMQFFEDYHYFKVQGYFIAQPMKLEELAKFIRSYAKARTH